MLDNIREVCANEVDAAVVEVLDELAPGVPVAERAVDVGVRAALVAS